MSDINSNQVSTKEDESSDKRFEKLAIKFLNHAGRHLTIGQKTYKYVGTHYSEVDNLNVTVRKFFLEQGITQSNNVVGNVVPIIQAITSIQRISRFPSWIGEGDKRFIAYKNGLLNLESFAPSGATSLEPHSPMWLSTTCLPYAFDSSASCPRWIAFLEQIWDGDNDRDEKIALLQEWFGYTLSDDTSLQKFMVKVGVPRAGKGTIDRIHEALLGPEATTGFSLRRLASDFGLAPLVGKSVAFVGEIDLGSSKDKFAILESLKGITGEDTQEINAKHAQQYSIRLGVRFSMSTNQLPSFGDPSGALASRMITLRFNRSFEGSENPHLVDELMSELPGISRWALEGLRRIRNSGRFTESSESIEAKREAKRANAPVLAFVQDCVYVSSRIDPGSNGFKTTPKSLTECAISKGALEDRYMDWCKANDIDPYRAWLGRNLKAVIPLLEYDKKRQVYRGIILQPSEHTIEHKLQEVGL